MNGAGQEHGEAAVRQPVRLRHVGGAIGLDAALTLVFVIIGRDTHTEALDAWGVLETWWPFLIGVAVGWMLTRAWRKPHGLLWQGVGIWASTVVVGMLIRWVAGQGTALPFVVVATVTLAVFLLGWRLIAVLVIRRRTQA